MRLTPKRVSDNLVDRQRRAVQRYRTFRRDVAGKMLGRLEEKAAAVAIRRDADDLCETVDVAGDDMAAELVAGPQRPLEIDAAAGLQSASVVFASVSLETSTVNSAPLCRSA